MWRLLCGAPRAPHAHQAPCSPKPPTPTSSRQRQAVRAEPPRPGHAPHAALRRVALRRAMRPVPRVLHHVSRARAQYGLHHATLADPPAPCCPRRTGLVVPLASRRPCYSQAEPPKLSRPRQAASRTALAEPPSPSCPRHAPPSVLCVPRCAARPTQRRASHVALRVSCRASCTTHLALRTHWPAGIPTVPTAPICPRRAVRTAPPELCSPSCTASYQPPALGTANTQLS